MKIMGNTIDLRHTKYDDSYNPTRSDGAPFYTKGMSTSFLGVNHKTNVKKEIQFLIATGAPSTSFCETTLKELKLEDGYEIKLTINNTEVLIIAHQNKLEGNVLGMDVLSKFVLYTHDKGVTIM